MRVFLILLFGCLLCGPCCISCQLAPCKNTSLHTCLCTDNDGNMVYAWSIEEDIGLASFQHAIFKSLIELLKNSNVDETIAKQQHIRIATRIRSPFIDHRGNLSCPYQNCPSQQDYILIPLDTSPRSIAQKIADDFTRNQFHNEKEGVSVVNVDKLTDMIQDYQIHQYVGICYQLHLYLEKMGINMKEIEGSSLTFLNKIKLMQKLVQEPNVKTVCEIGFNSGYSTLLWLTSGAEKVISFELGQYPYSTLAVEWLSLKFPGKFQVVLGDSQYTIPTFHTLFPQFENCDLIYIDGGHHYENVYHDIQNMIFMSNQLKKKKAQGKPIISYTTIDFNEGKSSTVDELKITQSTSISSSDNNNHDLFESILLIDDINQPAVEKAWQYFIEQDIVLEDFRISSNYSDHFLSSISDQLIWNGLKFQEESEFIIKEWESSMCVGRYR